jgi:hypothetical protein
MKGCPEGIKSREHHGIAVLEGQVIQELAKGQAHWLTPVIPATQEVEVGGSQSVAGPRQKCEILSKVN